MSKDKAEIPNRVRKRYVLLCPNDMIKISNRYLGGKTGINKTLTFLLDY